MSKDSGGSAPCDRTSSNDAEQCTTPTRLRDRRTHQDGVSLAQEDAVGSFVRRLDVLLEGVVQKLEQWLGDRFSERVQREASCSRAPAARLIPARRRRLRRSLTPRSSIPASSGARPSAAHSREAPLDPPRLSVLVDDAEPPPSTERSDPPTLPSASGLTLPSQTAAWTPAVEIVECGVNETCRDVEFRGDAVSPPSATRGTIAVADAIETLTRQGDSIRREGKE